MASKVNQTLVTQFTTRTILCIDDGWLPSNNINGNVFALFVQDGAEIEEVELLLCEGVISHCKLKHGYFVSDRDLNELLFAVNDRVGDSIKPFNAHISFPFSKFEDNQMKLIGNFKKGVEYHIASVRYNIKLQGEDGSTILKWSCC